MCGAAAWALSAPMLCHFSITRKASAPHFAWMASAPSASIAAPYSMQPCSASTLATFALKCARISSRLPGLAVMTAMTWIMIDCRGRRGTSPMPLPSRAAPATSAATGGAAARGAGVAARRGGGSGHGACHAGDGIAQAAQAVRARGEIVVIVHRGSDRSAAEDGGEAPGPRLLDIEREGVRQEARELLGRLGRRLHAREVVPLRHAEILAQPLHRIL